MMEKYEKAGKIVFEAAQEARKIAKPGAKLLDVAERVEAFIFEKGAKPAFPVNISINEEAAHRTPDFDEASAFGERDVVKIDIGAHVDGFIGDVAFTLDFSGENGKLVEASEKGLEAALACIKAGVALGKIGEEVEKAITSFGFKPIENLTGHSLGEYDLHFGLNVPNVRVNDARVLKEGDVVAIEPFATNGIGRVGEGAKVGIFSLIEKKQMRQKEARELVAFADENYRGLPFAERWLAKKITSKLALTTALRTCVLAEALKQYPILREAGKGLVSQAEVTVVVEKDSVRILTK